MRQFIRHSLKLSTLAFAASALLPLQTNAMTRFGAKEMSLETGFDEPAIQYGPRTWWHWINERVTKDGIRKDLEAMRTMGYKGVNGKSAAGWSRVDGG